jgi:hypothetical protein
MIPDNDLATLDAATRNAAIKSLLGKAKALAIQYYQLTGKPLGITGEVAEYEAAEKLGLVLTDARYPYFDAYCDQPDGRQRFQIKGRAVAETDKYRGRVPSVTCDGDYEAVLLVLLNKKTYDAIEIWRAEREAVKSRLETPGSKARNERNSLAITQFKSIAKKIWSAASQ